MIAGFMILAGCQLFGEFTVRTLNLPVPGPVVGMIVLLVGLQIRRPAPQSGVVHAADGLLQHLPLLFIPAGVGVIEYLPVLARSWLPAVGGLVIAWLVALVVTAGAGAATLRLQSRLPRARAGRSEGPE
jgi:holin-like protein